MATKVNIHQAKTNLSKLIKRAQAGEEIIIAKAGKPVVKLQVVSEPSTDDTVPQGFGCMKGQIWMGPDFDDSDPAVEDSFYNSEVFPP